MKSIFYRNDNGVGAVGILVVVTAYLFLASIIISFMLLNAFGVEGQRVVLPSQKDVKMYSSEQNFSSDNFDLHTISKDISSKWDNVPNVGMVLTDSASFGYSVLAIDNLQPNNDVYDNTYEINNTVHSDYCIVLRLTGGVDQNEICVDSEGFYIPAYFLNADTISGKDFSFTYPNAKLVEHPTIRTVYNDNTLSVDFYFNDVKMFTTTKLKTDSNFFDIFGRYYGGVAAKTNGFTLESFDSRNPIIQGLKDPNVVELSFGLLGTLLKIATFSIPTEFLPLEFQLIFIGLPEGLFVACVVIVLVRGVG